MDFTFESRAAMEAFTAFRAGRALNYFFAPDHTLIQFLPPAWIRSDLGTLLRHGYGGVGRGT